MKYYWAVPITLLTEHFRYSIDLHEKILKRKIHEDISWMFYPLVDDEPMDIRNMTIQELSLVILKIQRYAAYLGIFINDPKKKI